MKNIYKRIDLSYKKNKKNRVFGQPGVAPTRHTQPKLPKPPTRTPCQRPHGPYRPCPDQAAPGRIGLMSKHFGSTQNLSN